MKAKTILTAGEVSRLLRISMPTTLRGLRDGSIPGVRIGQQWRCSRQALEAFVRGSSSGKSGADAKTAA